MSEKNIFFRVSRLIDNISHDGLVWTISRIFLKILKSAKKIKRKKNKLFNKFIKNND